LGKVSKVVWRRLSLAAVSSGEAGVVSAKAMDEEEKKRRGRKRKRRRRGSAVGSRVAVRRGHWERWRPRRLV
jgi:ribosome assembly protein YihI (activator of Der GTPase)